MIILTRVFINGTAIEITHKSKNTAMITPFTNPATLDE